MHKLGTAILLSSGSSDSVLKSMFDPIASGLSDELKVAIPAVVGALTAVIVIVWGIPLVKKIVKGFIK